jgi:hypothetical protein
MKTSLFALVTLMSLTTAAQASWYQEFCSNAEGTIKTANGHNENYQRLTKRVWENGRVTDTVVEAEHLVPKAEGQSWEILKQEKRHCGPGQKYGFYSSRHVYAKSEMLVNADGSPFEKNIVGVSADQKSVHAMLICEMNMNSEMPCEK